MAFPSRPRRLAREADLAGGLPRPRGSYSAGTYIGCSACGRLLKIEWAVRSLVCSCGARVKLAPPDGK